MIRTRFMTHFFGKAITQVERQKELSEATVIGFDTEYTPKKKLICYQLCLDPKSPMIYRPPISWEILQKRIESDLLGRPIRRDETIYLTSYWSTAELQHLAVDEVFYKQWRPGVYDATWYIDKGRGTRSRKLRVLDVCQYFPYSTLAEAAGYFGLKKKKYDVRNLTRAALNDPEFVAYALNDARIVKLLFDRLREFIFKILGADIIKYRTVAAASLSCYRHSYLERDIEAPYYNVRKMGLFAVHGGAVQNYFRGERAGSIALYDAPSQWPQAAMNLQMLPAGGDWLRCDGLSEALNYHGIAAVRFRFPPKHRYPCLPVETHSGVFYPLSGVSYCTLEEIRLALSMGAKVRRLKYEPIYIYKTGTDSVMRYMWDFLQKKSLADTLQDEQGRAFYKKILNSLIGKFLQRTDYVPLSEIVRGANQAGMSTADYVATYSVEEDKKDGLLRSVNNTGPGWMPEWFALIVGYARASMFEAAWRLQALAITSDSMIIERDTPMKYYTFRGIRYDFKASADRFVSYREKLYSLLERGEFVHTAAHSNDIENAEVLEMLRTFHEWDTIEYRRKRVATLTDQVRNGIKWGSEIEINEMHDFRYPERGIVDDQGLIWPLAAAPLMETSDLEEVENGPNIFEIT